MPRTNGSKYSKNTKKKNSSNRKRRTHTAKDCNNTNRCPIHGRSVSLFHRSGHREHYERAWRHGKEGISELALGLAEQALKEFNVEYKTIRTAIPSPASTTSVITSITGIAQGDTTNTRNGNKIKVMSVQLKGAICANDSANTTLYRMLIFSDNSGEATAPVITDLFDSASDFYQGKLKSDVQNKNTQYRVILDLILPFSNSGKQCDVLKYYNKIHRHVYFTGVNSGDYGKGAIYMITSSDQGANTTTVNADCFVKFVDN